MRLVNWNEAQMHLPEVSWYDLGAFGLAVALIPQVVSSRDSAAVAMLFATGMFVAGMIYDALREGWRDNGWNFARTTLNGLRFAVWAMAALRVAYWVKGFTPSA